MSQAIPKFAWQNEKEFLANPIRQYFCELKRRNDGVNYFGHRLLGAASRRLRFGSEADPEALRAELPDMPLPVGFVWL